MHGSFHAPKVSSPLLFPAHTVLGQTQCFVPPYTPVHSLLAPILLPAHQYARVPR